MNDLISAFGDLLADIATHTSNRALETDPKLRERLEELEGNTVEINCQLPPVTWHFLVTNGALTLRYGAAEAPQVIVSGNAADLGTWVITGEAPGGVDIEGDETLLEELQRIFREFEPDIEDPLSQFVGPQVASTLLGTAEIGLKGLKSLVEGIGSATRGPDKSEFVSKDQLETVLSGIDDLRLRVDRLAAKVNEVAEKEGAKKEPADTSEQPAAGDRD